MKYLTPGSAWDARKITFQMRRWYQSSLHRFNLKTWRGSATEKTCTLPWRKVILGIYNYNNLRCVIFWVNLYLAENHSGDVTNSNVFSAICNNSRLWAAMAVIVWHAVQSSFYSKARVWQACRLNTQWPNRLCNFNTSF